MPPPLVALHPEEIAEELRRGRRFVIYYYCVTFFFWSYKKPSRILLLQAARHGAWHGLPVRLRGDHRFWRGLPYSLLSLVLGGPLVAVGGLMLVGYLFAMDFPGDQEWNVLLVLPVFILTFWGLPWGYIYLASCLASNCVGGQDVTDEVAALLPQPETPGEQSEESNHLPTSAPPA